MFFTQAAPLLDFLRRQPVTYGIVLKNSVKQLERLDVIGNHYLIKITPTAGITEITLKTSKTTAQLMRDKKTGNL
jgi:hypothetical protein